MKGQNLNDDNELDNDDDKDVTTMTMTLFFMQQPTLGGCIPGRERVGDFYYDDANEDNHNGNDDNEEN